MLSKAQILDQELKKDIQWNESTIYVVAPWLRRWLSTGGSWVRLPP